MNNKKTYNPFSLEGKNILVTGASSGIGRAIAVECSKMGANVVATARNETRLAETLAAMDSSGTHKSVIADMADSDALAALVESIETPLDGVVLCAGVGSSVMFPFLKTKKLRDLFDVNFFPAAELSYLLLKKKKIAKPASVVMISSIGGNGLFLPGQSAYASSKAALTALAKCMATDLAPKEIRVNCILPGMVETPLIREGYVLTEEDIKADVQKYPLKRYGRPEEVAYATIYLLSDASAWTTGTNLILDGGATLL